MKTLGIAAFVLAAVALGADLYAVIETLPNYKSMSLTAQTDGDRILRALVDSYHGTLRSLAYTALGAGVLGTILGGVAGVKGWKPGFVAAGLALAAAAWQFAWAV